MASTSAPPEVRSRVRVYWPIEQQWFEGTVDRISEQHGVQYFRVSYDDADVQWHAANETWECLRFSKRTAHDHLTSSANCVSTVVAKRIKDAPSLKRGQRISVYWQDEGKWFEGTVRDYDRCSGCHLVVYDDGDQRHENLEDDPKVQWSVCGRAHTGKSKISRGTDGALAVQLEQAVWACCDKCGKWRRLPSGAECAPPPTPPPHSWVEPRASGSGLRAPPPPVTPTLPTRGRCKQRAVGSGRAVSARATGPLPARARLSRASGRRVRGRRGRQPARGVVLRDEPGRAAQHVPEARGAHGGRRGVGRAGGGGAAIARVP